MTQTESSQPDALAPRSFKTPPKACDAHFHVFGLAQRYPTVSDALYPPPPANLDDYLKVAAGIGVERFVLVQPSIYGTDNRCTLEALRTLGAERSRAVLDVDEGLISEAQFAEWHSVGVRALRIHTHVQRIAGLTASWRPRLKRLAAIAKELGWHLDFLMPGWLTSEFLPDLRGLKIDFTVAHLGYFRASEGVEQPGFQDLLSLLREGSHCWLKLTGFYRMSERDDCEDVKPFVETLLETAPDRLIWGTDFPHVYVKREIDTLHQFDLFRRFATADEDRRRILVANPARLYGFNS